MYILITYDISSDKRRNKIDKLLSSHGYRVNYSVFELEVKTHVFRDIKLELKKFMGKHDSVRIYTLDKTALDKAVELGESRENPFEKESSYV